MVAQQDGVTVAVFAFDVVGGRITHIWAVRDPRSSGPGRRADLLRRAEIVGVTGFGERGVDLDIEG
ncbi:MAG: hypothetical protein ACRDO0_09445 [Nocardioidaceae bacterium]